MERLVAGEHRIQKMSAVDPLLTAQLYTPLPQQQTVIVVAVAAASVNQGFYLVCLSWCYLYDHDAPPFFRPVITGYSGAAYRIIQSANR